MKKHKRAHKGDYETCSKYPVGSRVYINDGFYYGNVGVIQDFDIIFIKQYIQTYALIFISELNRTIAVKTDQIELY